MSIFESVQSWNRVRRTQNALNTLTERQLQDIGLTRGAIEGIARHNRYR